MAGKRVAKNVRVRDTGDIIKFITELANWRIWQQLRLMLVLYLAIAVTLLVLVVAVWLLFPHQFWIVVDHFRCGGYCK